MIETVLDFGQRYGTWLVALSGLSVASLLLMAAFGTRVIARLPADHFRAERAATPSRLLPWLVRNLVGALLVLAGVAMLLLPGQGLLTMLAGLLLMDFPGKRNLERRLLRVPQLRRSVDWLRKRAEQPPLELDDAADAADAPPRDTTP